MAAAQPTEEAVREVFDLFETNDHGCISVADTCMAIRGLGHTPSNEELQEKLTECGIDTECSFENFRHLSSIIQSDVTQTDVADAFKLFDATARGTMSGKDFVGILQAWGNKLSQEETDEFMRLAKISESSTVNCKDMTEQMMPS
eukprot:m.140041 g.140041  ORF g.140041 m.140041 type:complete len:145 (+) comp11518_c1_seq2:100-534(+)